LGITTTVEVNNLETSTQKEECVINPRLFSEIVKKMPVDDITVKINHKGDMKAHIKAQNTNFKISVLSAEDYPELPDTSNGDLIEIEAKTLKEMINQTIYAVSVSDIKPVLTGELFDIQNGSFNLVAIDGKRLAVRHEPIAYQDTQKFVVPSKTLNEVSKLIKDEAKGNCKIVNTSRHIIFQVGNYTVLSRILEGNFYDYQANTPKNYKKTVVVKTQELIQCLERCSLLINEKNRAPVKLNFTGMSLKVQCDTPLGNIDEEIQLEDNVGGDLLIGLNNKFLLDALRATDSDKVKVLLDSPISPVFLRPVIGDSFSFLLMVIQLKENH
jgi:DNA polymerase-3 subunit beta